MAYDVTIGIPVYKSVEVICRAIESALAQTFSSIEYLIIDDAGCDGSVDIVRKIKQTHVRGQDIRIISHKDNLGVSASRNQIIDEAQGKFLYFMDSDDVIAEKTIELLMQNVRQYNAEIVFGSYERVDLSGMKTVYQYPSMQLLKTDELACFAYRKYAGIQASACNYLVKTSILHDNKLRFINTNFWEDFVFTFDLVTLVSRAVLLPDITYSYICRKNSLSNYQERCIILKDEVMQNVKAINHLKQTSSELYDKVYFPNRCYNIVLTDFYIVCNILRRRNDIFPYITNKDIQSIMSHPATWMQICSFSCSRIKNQLFYILGKLPSSLCVFAIKCIGKVKKLI